MHKTAYVCGVVVCAKNTVWDDERATRWSVCHPAPISVEGTCEAPEVRDAARQCARGQDRPTVKGV